MELSRLTAKRVADSVACVNVMVVRLSLRWLLKTAGIARSTPTGLSRESGDISWMGGCMDGWMDGWTHAWMDGWIDTEASWNQHWTCVQHGHSERLQQVVL